MNEEQLQTNQEFARCTEQLAGMMQTLISSAQPRAEKKDFLSMLRYMAESSKNAKAFGKKLYEDYRAKTINFAEAYKRFEIFSEDASGMGDPTLPELSPVEMRLCYDEYREDDEVKEAWADSGAEGNTLIQAMMCGGLTGPPPSLEGPEGGGDKKGGKKLKASDISEMQELMVDELKRTSIAFGLAISVGPAPDAGWKPDIAIPLTQALASAAVERRYNVSAEEMTIAGFMHAAQLQQNERFCRATEKQQEILSQLPGMCGGAASAGATGSE